MPTPMPSASNSCAREKFAIVSLVLASASAVRSGSLLMSVTTRVDDRGLPRLVLADRGVLGQHMRHLVAQHRGQFRGVAGERDQAARDIELAGRQREGVHRAGIEDRDLVGLVGTVGGRDQPVDGLADQRFQLRVVIDAAIGGEDALMLALGGRRLRDRAVRLAARAPSGAAVWKRPMSPQARQRQRRAQQRRRSPKAARPFPSRRPARSVTSATGPRSTIAISSLFCA